MDQNREDMRKKLEEARQHFAKELHNDQVTVEREKLKRNRKAAGGVATHRQAWSDFEATDWASSGPITLVRDAHPHACRLACLACLPARWSAHSCGHVRWDVLMAIDSIGPSHRLIFHSRTSTTLSVWGATPPLRNGRLHIAKRP